MTVFWAIVVLLLAGALLMILPGLWQARPQPALPSTLPMPTRRRPAADGLTDVAELAAPRPPVVPPRVAAATTVAAGLPRRATALAIGVLLPTASVLTYLQLGAPEAIAPLAAAPAAAAAGERHALTPELLQQRAAALAERLRVAPGDAEGWLTLARSYTVLGRFRDAAAALRRAADLLPPNATLLADLADLVAMAQGKRLAGEPVRLIQRALDIDPRHVKALALAGTAALELRDGVAARGYWERLLAVLPADSPLRRSAEGSLAEAQRLEGALPAATAGVAAAPAASAPSMAAGAGIAGTVRIAPSLAGRLQPGDTLFVFARAVDGPRMPLALLRLAAAATPQAFALDDAQALAPGLKLSAFERVVIGARVSRSGNATPQPGDLVGQSGPVRLGARELELVIDRVQP